jgi:hypothetical protein
LWLYPSWWENEDCWYYLVADKCFIYSSYVRGLGGPYYYCDDWRYGRDIRELVYYKKGDKTWGTPLVITSVENVEKEESIILFPNPVRDILQIQFTEFKNSPILQLMDLQGRLLMEKELEANANFVDLSAFSTGMYIYRITEAGQVISTGKIFKTAK